MISQAEARRSNRIFAMSTIMCSPVNEAIVDLRERLTAAFEASLLLSAARQNDIVKKLGSWAAILAVPTAIAGIYGMNFKYMPELEWSLGYPFASLLMLGICGTLFSIVSAGPPGYSIPLGASMAGSRELVTPGLRVTPRLGCAIGAGGRFFPLGGPCSNGPATIDAEYSAPRARVFTPEREPWLFRAGRLRCPDNRRRRLTRTRQRTGCGTARAVRAGDAHR